MSSFELVDGTSGHGMLVFGPSNLDRTFAEEPGSHDAHLVGVDDPMDLATRPPDVIDNASDVAPHPRFAHLGGTALEGANSQF